MAESIHKRKGRVRPPRVHITYETNIGDAVEMKEIPFVMGVLSDLSGQPAEPLEKLKDRKFIEIDRDNFDSVMQRMKPRLALRVENALENDGSELSVELNFNKLEDFDPENVAKQVEPLRQILEARGKLKDLLSRMEGNDRLEELLSTVLDDADVQGKLKSALGTGEDAEQSEAPATDEQEES